MDPGNSIQAQAGPGEMEGHLVDLDTMGVAVTPAGVCSVPGAQHDAAGKLNPISSVDSGHPAAPSAPAYFSRYRSKRHPQHQPQQHQLHVQHQSHNRQPAAAPTEVTSQRQANNNTNYVPNPTSPNALTHVVAIQPTHSSTYIPTASPTADANADSDAVALVHADTDTATSAAKTLRKKPSRYRQRSTPTTTTDDDGQIFAEEQQPARHYHNNHPPLPFDEYGPFPPPVPPLPLAHAPLPLGPRSNNLTSIVTRSADPLSQRGAAGDQVAAAGVTRSPLHHHDQPPFRGDENSDHHFYFSQIDDHDDHDATLYRTLTERTRDSGKSFRERTTESLTSNYHPYAHPKMTTTTRWVDAPTTVGGSQPEIRRHKQHDEFLEAPSPPLASPKVKSKRPIFAFLSRSRKADQSAVVPTSPASIPQSPQLNRTIAPPKYIEAGGKGIVPQIDAPVSASNSAERVCRLPFYLFPKSQGRNSILELSPLTLFSQRVVVRCMNSSITLPVKTNTTPIDILHSAANLITHRIRPDSSVVVESYLQYGLERRLRRYELVRDVMNSWDRDNLNALVVLPAGISSTPTSADPVPDNDELLEIDAVPRTYDAPYAFTLQLYHCARIGKWTKRIVTLLDSGQMYSAKKPGAQLSDKDSVSLCHLSDFDLYTPTEHQVKKVLKPPKKYCYAVKSQQKSHMFPNGENFVHFFCTDDPRTSRLFREQVHGWRSWYLVNRKIDTGDAGNGGVARRPSQKSVGGHKARHSVDGMPYAIGTFKPLMDMDIFEKSYDDPTHDPNPAVTSPQEPTHRKRLSKGSVRLPQGRNRSASNYTGPPNGAGLVNVEDPPDFDAKGLLGDKYEERKQEQLRRTETRRRRESSEGPFTEGPSLLNSIPSAESGDPLRRSESRYRPTTARPTTADVNRQRSQRYPSRPSSPTSVGTSGTSATRRAHEPPPGMPKPLLDFSEKQAEPTSWRNQVRGGQGVRAPVGVPLVDLATGGRAPDRFGVPASPGGRARAPSTSAASHQREGPFVRHPQGETLLGQIARSQSVASSSSRYRSRRAHDEEPVPPLPMPGSLAQGGTLLGQLEARQGASRGRSGTVR
ncbi:hypothetical protein jhhlp_006627 [Lomentospora prolificans]|uniref:PH domain-containing protein n=1 Tax=Lomentospora prolificans TaxID=41688 RepID=A0A2N3N6F4_9PEZI|nr:hypothetical protein jhhlp_006627 [Lomentospora prolificans]